MAEAKKTSQSAIDGIDKTVHSPARLKILAILSVVEKGDFTFLKNQSGLTQGNLSSHLGVLEEAGYIKVEKRFVDRIPRTLVNISAKGSQAIQDYRENMQAVLSELVGE